MDKLPMVEDEIALHVMEEWRDSSLDIRWFDPTDPHIYRGNAIARLLEYGLIEIVEGEYIRNLLKYRITEAGRDFLANNEPEEGNR
jgi:DNA-binding PadR family transcriptional regulator